MLYLHHCFLEVNFQVCQQRRLEQNGIRRQAFSTARTYIRKAPISSRQRLSYLSFDLKQAYTLILIKFPISSSTFSVHYSDLPFGLKQASYLTRVFLSGLCLPIDTRLLPHSLSITLLAFPIGFCCP
jgi:hypothetical protein